MKKTLALLFALILCLSLCACGNDNSDAAESAATTAAEDVLISKDEMLANAVEIDDYEKEFTNNKLRAQEMYVGNNYLVVGNIVGIESTYIEIQSIVNNSVSFGVISISLPVEDLMNLTTGQRVKIVGNFDSFTEEEKDMGYGFTETVYNVVMTNGYVVADTFEFSGLLRMYYVDFRDIDGRVHHQYGDPDAWSIGLDTTSDNVLSVNLSMENEIPVEHVAGQNITSVQFGGQEIANETRITVSAKLINSELVDAQLISVG